MTSLIAPATAETHPIADKVLGAVSNLDTELIAVGVGALAVGATVLVFRRGWRFFKGLSG